MPSRKRMMTTTKMDEQNLCPSRKRKLDSSQPATKEQPANQHPCSTSAPEHALKLCKEKRKTKSSKEKISSASSTIQETSQPSSLCSICPPSIAVQYMNLVENWVPNTIKRELELTNSDDEDCSWAEKKPTSQKLVPKSCEQLDKNNETKEVTSSSISWPRARFLPGADIYALPYTVPF